MDSFDQKTLLTPPPPPKKKSNKTGINYAFSFLCNCIKADFTLSAGLTGFSCESLLSLRSDWAHGAWGSLVTYWTLLTNWTVWPGGTWVANHTLSSLLTDSSLKTRITSGPLGTCISWKSGVSLGSLNKGMYTCKDETETYDFSYKKNKV